VAVGGDLPSGTVTLLFTDIEGSTRLVRELRGGYADVRDAHRRLLRAVFETYEGHEIDTQGDAFFVAFRRANDAVAAAAQAQQALAEHEWPEGSDVRVRMGVHTSEPTVGDEGYHGLGVHRAARICAAGHGGQVLLSNITRDLVEDELPDRLSLIDLGEHRLKDLERPERIHQLVYPGVPAAFPPLKTLEAKAADTSYADSDDELAAGVAARLQFRILGPLEVRQGDQLLPLGGAKQRALLALLLLNANRVVSRERLIDALWGDEPPETAVTSVQVYVSRLRKLFPTETLVTKAPGYLLAVDPEEIDLLRFEKLLAHSRGADPERRSRMLREALTLWRGPPLDEFNEPFAQGEGGRLEDLHLAAIEEQIEAELTLGRHADLIGELEALIAEHPHRERFRGQLMLALYRSGRQAEALEAYRDARAALDELGIEPNEGLRVLEKQILTQDATLVAPPPLLGDAIILPGPLRVASAFPFVGRTRELTTLRSLLREAEDGHSGQVALLSGEAGGGKSRLVRELAHEAAERGTLVLYGSSDAVINAPYQPFVQALEFLVRVCDPKALEQCLGGGRGELARLLPELGQPAAQAAGDPETQRHRLHKAAVELLTRVSEQHPLLVIVDDLHWTDAPSLQLFLELARAAPEARVFLLATHRDRSEDMRPEFFGALASLARIDGVTRISVGGLSDEDVAEFIRNSTGSNDDTAVSTLATAIHALTEGTPFLLCEFWRLLLDVEAVETSNGAPRLTRPLAELGSPEGVRDVVHYRLSRLAPATTEMLELAAVVGAQFELGVLEGASKRVELVSSLEEALKSGTIEEVPGAGLSHRFAHELVRRALYERLSGVRRAELHLRVGETLERVHAADPDRVLSELAHHFAVAASLGGTERAVQYNLRAAETAMGSFALGEAAKRLSTALDLGIADVHTRGRVELELARALWLNGEHERAGEVLDDALESAEAAGDEQTEWYVLLERAGTRPDRDLVELETLSRNAVTVFERLGDDLGLARARRRIALAASQRCAFGEAARESERALTHAVAAGDKQEEARIVDALCTALLYGPAPASDGIARCHELLEQARGNPMTEAVILSSLAGLDAMTGRLDDARTDYRRAGAIYAELELPWFIAALSAISAPIELGVGNAEGAASMLRVGIELLAERAAPDAIAYRSALLALALLAQGKRDDAFEALGAAEPARLMTRTAHCIAASRVNDDVSMAREAVALASKTEALNLHADARATLGELLAARGSDEAPTHLRIALELYEQKENELAAGALRPHALEV
jgi:DNA-binding SARP family transcriptional activator/class 3 adenylate cyclase/tetratricopeptide (TPR) repeat protein